MKLRVSELPEGLREEVRRVWGRHPDSGSARHRAVQLWSWQTAQSRALTPAMILGAVAFIWIVLLASSWGGAHDRPDQMGYVLSAVLLGVALIVGAARGLRNAGNPALSSEDLARIAPLLSLSPPQAAYLKAVVESRAEALPELARLAEADARLAAMEGELGRGDPDLSRRIARTEGQIRATEDPPTREALASSLDLMRRRLAATERAGVLRGRVAAHRALLAEQARSLDAATEPLAPERPAYDLEALRERADETSRDLVALEAAVQEVREL